MCVGGGGGGGGLVDDSVGNLELYGNLFLTVSDSIFWTKILKELPNIVTMLSYTHL